MGIFKKIDGNILGGNFLGKSFPDALSTSYRMKRSESHGSVHQVAVSAVHLTTFSRTFNNFIEK